MPSVTWTSECGIHETRVELSRDQAQCHIFHEPVGSVHIEGLMSVWDADGSTTAVLPCGHTYGVAALAIHFLSNDMRCPVCRAGHTVRMRLDSVPAALQDSFACKTSTMQTDSSDTDSNEDTDAEIDDDFLWRLTPAFSLARFLESIHEIERQLRLTTEICTQDATYALDTTVYRDHDQTHAVPDTGMRRYEVQHSFTRNMGIYIARNAARADMCIRVYVDHPLFDTVLSSAQVPLPDFLPGCTLEIDSLIPSDSTIPPPQSDPIDSIGRVQHTLDDGIHRFVVCLHTHNLMAMCMRKLQEDLLTHTIRHA